MTSYRQTTSPSRSSPSNSDTYHDHACPHCGHQYVAKSGSSCPNCGGSVRPGDEVTKKILDEPDLRKGLA
jgi:predicted RNA-binding Zn-ribbon protein involved in translation (DUF1610 family)